MVQCEPLCWYEKLSAQSRVHQAFGYKQGTIAIHRCTYTSGAL